MLRGYEGSHSASIGISPRFLAGKWLKLLGLELVRSALSCELDSASPSKVGQFSARELAKSLLATPAIDNASGNAGVTLMAVGAIAEGSPQVFCLNDSP